MLRETKKKQKDHRESFKQSLKNHRKINKNQQAIIENHKRSIGKQKRTTKNTGNTHSLKLEISP